MNISKINGKNILFVDLETTGLPIKKKGWNLGKDEYYDPTDNSKYDSSRIVQIGWYYIENFSNNKIVYDDIIEFIRKPIDFHEIKNSEIHGVTYENARSEGKHLSKILNDEGFGYAIENTDYIVGHNVLFDIYILLNELHRIKFKVCFSKLKNLLDTDKYICTLRLGTDICELQSKNMKTYKPPKLEELYDHYYHTEPKKQHTAGSDVKTLLEIVVKMNV